jgi:hypothetical protein
MSPSIAERPSATPTSIQQTSTASKTTASSLAFTQIGTVPYDSSTSPTSLTFPSNLSGITPTTTLSNTVTFFPQSATGLYPMLNVTQGSTDLANVSTTYAVTVSPIYSTTVVTLHEPALWTSTGNTPSEATYTVYFNETHDVQYFIAATPTWVLANGITESLNYTVTVPTGYVVNQTTIFVPWAAGIPINGTTLNITLAGRNLTTYQLVDGGVNAFIPGLSATSVLHIRYYVAPTQTGPIPVVPLGVVYYVGNGYYQANATWINTRTLPYGGILFVTTNLSETVVSGSLTATAYFKAVRNGTYAIAGNVIEMFPGSFTARAGAVLFLQFTFRLVGALQPASIVANYDIVGNFTVGEGLIVAAIVFLLIAFAVYWERRRVLRWRTALTAGVGFWSAVMLSVFAMFLYLAISGYV